MQAQQPEQHAIPAGLLSKKVDVLTLARITGHKDIRMLMIYYQTDMADVARQIG